MNQCLMKNLGKDKGVSEPFDFVLLLFSLF